MVQNMHMTSRASVDGAVRLRTGVHSHSEVLGLQASVSANAMPVTLRLPNRSSGRRLTIRGSHWGLSGHDWGYENSEQAVTVRSVGFHLDDDSYRELDEEQFAQVVASLDQMIADLWWWLAIPALEVPDMLDSLPAVTWAHPDADLAMYSASWGEHFTDTTVIHSRASWEHAISHVHNEDAPPIPMRLILSARENLSRGDLRPAVLDAATAIEAALSYSITRRLRELDPSDSLVKLILERKTLGAIVDIAKELDIPCPTEIRKNLIERRNKVMHKGLEIDRREAKDAVETAQKGVEMLRPQLNSCVQCEQIRAELTARQPVS